MCARTPNMITIRYKPTQHRIITYKYKMLILLYTPTPYSTAYIEQPTTVSLAPTAHV